MEEYWILDPDVLTYLTYSRDLCHDDVNGRGGCQGGNDTDKRGQKPGLSTFFLILAPGVRGFIFGSSSLMHDRPCRY